MRSGQDYPFHTDVSGSQPASPMRQPLYATLGGLVNAGETSSVLSKRTDRRYRDMRTTQCAAFFSTVLAAAESFAAMPIDVYAINNGSSLPHPPLAGVRADIIHHIRPGFFLCVRAPALITVRMLLSRAGPSLLFLIKGLRFPSAEAG